MNLTPRRWLPVVLAAAVLAPATSAAAATPTPPPADPKAVVDLTFDLTVGLFAAFAAEDDTAAHDHAEYVPAKFSRPTDAPLPRTNLLTQMGLKLSPGTTIVISVFSNKQVNDSVCITGTSTKTPTVLYLSTKTLRPSLTRPYGCSRPGAKPMVTPPPKSMQVAPGLAALESDIKSMSIAEESYATDNNGAFAAETISRPTKAQPARSDLLVQQGGYISVGDQIDITLFTTNASTPNDSFCITGTVLKTHQKMYLSSANDVLTRHRPHGCIVQ